MGGGPTLTVDLGLRSDVERQRLSDHGAGQDRSQVLQKPRGRLTRFGSDLLLEPQSIDVQLLDALRFVLDREETDRLARVGGQRDLAQYTVGEIATEHPE